MSNLLDHALARHGGLDRWRAIQTISANITPGGALFALKGYPDGLGTAEAIAEVSTPRLTFTSFAGRGRGVFEADRVTVTTNEGAEQRRENPRAAFADHQLETTWDDLHLLYFTGYAIWNYLCTPFLLAWPGFVTEEIEPWQEGAETWRCLRVEFPPEIPTHCAEQVFYFDESGLLRRLDYSPDVIGASGVGAAHYCYDHRDFSGLIVPTRRRVYARREDGTPALDQVFVELDVADLAVMTKTEGHAE